MEWTEDDAHNPPGQTVEFLGIALRVPSLVEMLVSQRDNTLVQLAKCANWYRTRALDELYPRRKNLGSLNSSMRRSVTQRAIEMVVADCKAEIPRP